LPELPEIEHLKRTLEPALLGAAVRRVDLRRQDVARAFDDSRRVAARDLLQGTTVRELRRHGKNLAIIGDNGRVLCVHLGMSGQMLFVPHGARLAKTDHVHCAWRLATASGPGRLVFRDPRRFGGLCAIGDTAELTSRCWSSLGPDALTITARQLAMKLRRTRRAIKAALLDQAVLAGVGNIYADEALFRAGLHPQAVAANLRSESIERLADAVRSTLLMAITAGGSTIRDYVDAAGRNGDFSVRHQVYGRANLPCVVCGEALASATIAQRTTVFCRRCQRPRR
jgi:formamidopyrimidine-DNA glycosylase